MKRIQVLLVCILCMAAAPASRPAHSRPSFDGIAGPQLPTLIVLRCRCDGVEADLDNPPAVWVFYDSRHVKLHSTHHFYDGADTDVWVLDGIFDDAGKPLSDEEAAKRFGLKLVGTTYMPIDRKAKPEVKSEYVAHGSIEAYFRVHH